ncbi:Alpha/beta fold hydrolase [Hyphomicrobiales bacterium]|nr:Alpha/beta fold hydrolase [Hyphomicrobiales bacterium]CAH1682613.1 Alpha/beta fold hydrolase [Hyphomicrobiales bacterium]
MMRRGRMDVAGIAFDVLSGGEGPATLVLHGLQTFDPAAPFLEALAGSGLALMVTSHPGFAATPRPPHVATVEDVVNAYLDLLDQWPSGPVNLVGLSFGGWIAAEIAVRYGHRLAKLVLIDALGIRINRRETPDILHIFNEPPEMVARATWADPAQAPDFAAMSDDAVVAYAANREASCRYGWRPYMHSPRLLHWLHRIKVPTLVAWGAADGIVTPAYGQAYAAAIPGAMFRMIEGAGHHPDVEKPGELAAVVSDFLKRTTGHGATLGGECR